jgi:hypothetical protein
VGKEFKDDPRSGHLVEASDQEMLTKWSFHLKVITLQSVFIMECRHTRVIIYYGRSLEFQCCLSNQEFLQV